MEGIQNQSVIQVTPEQLQNMITAAVAAVSNAKRTTKVVSAEPAKKSKYGKQVDSAKFSHLGRISEKGYRQVFFKGASRNFAMWLKNDTCLKIRLDTPAKVVEYHKDYSEAPTSLAVRVPLVAGNVVKFVSLVQKKKE